MTASRWSRLQELFDRLLELPANDRSAWLDAYEPDAGLRAEAARLVREHDASGGAGLTSPLGRAAADIATPASAGQRIGAYALIREIGSGGMGTVFLAERVDDEFAQRVAIKLIRGIATRDMSHRLRRERQILAGLDHSNIARLFDGGTSDAGQPYLVMEYIDGESLTDHARSHGLPLDRRLRLLQQVCHAVHYAHRRLVIHRDLKPANVLMRADGTPALLDFGIAKLLDTDTGQPQETRTALPWFTPAYASPEQRTGGAVSTATDIYGLGALLHHLLTDAIPQPRADGGLPPPSTLRNTAGQPAGDRELDIIVGKATHPDPERRYDSGAALADDLERYLAGRPIQAAPDRAGYRLRKFVRRNRVSVGLGLLAVAILFATSTWALHQAYMTRLQATRAERHFASVRDLANRFVHDVYREIADIPGTSRAQTILLDTGIEYLGRLATDAGDNRALLLEIAAGYVSLARTQERMHALPEQRRQTAQLVQATLDRADALAPRDATSLRWRLRALTLLATAELGAQQFDAARAYFESAAVLAHETLHSRESFELAVSRAELFTEYGKAAGIDIPARRRLGLVESARASYEVARSLAASDTDRDAADNALATTLIYLARVKNEDVDDPGRLAVALAYADEALRIQEVLHARLPNDMPTNVNLVMEATTAAAIAAGHGDYERARDYYRTARRYDENIRRLDPEQPVAAINRIVMRLGQIDMEMRAHAPPLEQFAEIAEVERLIAGLPDHISGQRQFAALRAWVATLEAEFSLRRSEEAGLAQAERLALKRESLRRFEEAGTLIALAPEAVLEENRDTMELLRTGPRRARASLAALQPR